MSAKEEVLEYLERHHKSNSVLFLLHAYERTYKMKEYVRSRSNSEMRLVELFDFHFTRKEQTTNFFLLLSRLREDKNEPLEVLEEAETRWGIVEVKGPLERLEKARASYIERQNVAFPRLVTVGIAFSLAFLYGMYYDSERNLNASLGTFLSFVGLIAFTSWEGLAARRNRKRLEKALASLVI